MTIAVRTVLLVGGLAAAALPAPAQTRPQADPEVRTAATAQRTVPPDLATLTLQFSADGSNAADAGSRLATMVASLRRAFATLGIPPDSIINRGRSYWWRGRIEVVPQPVRWVERTTPAPDGRRRDPVQDTVYRAHDALEVRIHDMSKVGAVLDTAMGRGITDIAPVQFTATDLSAAQESALREATQRARRQAEAIAQASGMQLGAVLALGTQGSDGYSYGSNPISVRGGVSLSVSGEQVGTPTVVVQPSVPVSVTVYGRWALVPKP